MEDDAKEILLLLRFITAHTIASNDKYRLGYWFPRLAEDSERAFALDVLESLKVFEDDEGQRFISMLRAANKETV